MNNMARTGKKKKTSRRETVIALILVAALIVFAFIMWQQISAAQQERVRTMSTPLVRTMVMSADGQQHHFEAQITLQVSGNARGVTNQQVTEQITAALSGLRHEDIISADGMDIIRNTVRNTLENGTFREGDIQSVFVTNVLNDFMTPQQPASDRRNEFLRRLQGN